MIIGKVVIFFAFAVALALSSKVKNPRDYVSEDPGENFNNMTRLDDMLLSREQMLNLFTTPRNGLINERYRWPDATVFYKIKEGFNSEEKALIFKAMEEISVRSCIKFRKLTKEPKYYVKIYKHPERCFATMGCVEKSRLGLTPRCSKKIGKIWHLLLHVLGFYHMHTSYDRDNYVRIYLKNVEESQRHNFRKYTNKHVSHFGVPYDYSSVMHYSKKAFSVNGKNTIVPVNPDAKIGQRYKLSDGDVQRIVAMYKCPGDK